MWRLIAVSIVTLLISLRAEVSVALEATQGVFLVSKKCEAYQSFKNMTNPGELYVQPGERLKIAQVNRDRYEWVRVNWGGENKDLRWVSTACGTVEGLVVSDGGVAECRVPDLHDSYVLAVTWQPGFCEHNKAGPNKPECKAMESGKLMVTNFTLHGLWPNKEECGIDYGKCNGADMDLSASTVDYLKPWMPNFYYGTQFGSYEWNKHGVCQTAMTDDEYFIFAADLVKSFNDSEAGEYIRNNAGGEVSRKEFYGKLTNEYGIKTVENNFILTCSGEFLEEVRVALPRDFKGARTIKDVIGDHFASKRASDKGECSSDKIRIESSGKGT